MAKHRPKNEASNREPAPADKNNARSKGKHAHREQTSDASATREPAWIDYGLRLWLAAMLGWTLWVTRPIWTAHAFPPMLPAIESPLSRFDYFGEALFAAFAATVVWPRFGWWSYVAIAATAMISDQTRMQPQMFSFALLLLGTWPNPTAKLIARTHLASLWFFSGVHKLFSPGYYDLVAPWLWRGVMPVADHPGLDRYSSLFGAALALVEVGMGITIWFPAMRRYVAWLVPAMHFGIVALLDHLNGWNTSVWGWNCAIAVVGFVLVGQWREPVRVDLVRCGSSACVAAALLFASPVLFYFGTLDAYLCHCLYSANVASGEFHPADGKPPYMLNWIGEPANVPLPPAHRLFEAYFRAVAQAGDRLLVRDPRWWAKGTLNNYYEWRCDQSGGLCKARLPESGK